MNTQKPYKLSRLAAPLLALFTLPALMCAQAAPTTTTPAKTSAARRNTVTPSTQPTAAQPPIQADNAQATTDAGAAAGTIAGQVPSAANTTVQAIQPVVSNTPVNTTTADPTSQVQNGINQVNEKKKKAKSIWNQIKTIKK